MHSFIYRSFPIVNYLVNTCRFRKLRCGKNVVINISKHGKFSYGTGTWLAEGTRVDIFDTTLTLAEQINICKNTQLSPGKSGIKIGNRTKIQEGSRLIGEITIGDDVIIGPNFYMSSGIHVFKQEPAMLVSLQDRKFNHYAEPCVIEDDCWIGINVCVMPGVTIRRGSIIGAGAVVTRSTEPYGIYAGLPAKKIGQRLTLMPKMELDAVKSEDLPYFYKGFDHFNYEQHKNTYQGIMAHSGTFSIYAGPVSAMNMTIEIESKNNSAIVLTHNQQSYKIQPGLNKITISPLNFHEHLINFTTTDQLLIKKVTFA